MEYWKLDRQDVPVAAWCARCGGECYAPHEPIWVDARGICLDCLAELLAQLLERSRAAEGRGCS